MFRFSLLLIGSTILSGACGGQGEDAAVRPPVTLTGEAKVKWDTLCVTCHGNKGTGDGPSAAPLAVKPRSFGDATWQGSVTDEHLAKVIVEGGKAVGKSELMPANPDLVNKKDVVAKLVKKVRSFRP